MFDQTALQTNAANGLFSARLRSWPERQSNRQTRISFGVADPRFEIARVGLREQSRIVDKERKLRPVKPLILRSRCLRRVEKFQSLPFNHRRWVRGESRAHQPVQNASSDVPGRGAFDFANHLEKALELLACSR